jgi:glycine/D-amino acid oxidase-like deaminating enzyme/nitrite reductase/ring-hydroxylating ferredoxin subunit
MTEREPTTGPSCWIETADEARRFEPLRGDARTDVVVVGGGIVGVSTALMLQRAGRNVTLLDAARIGRAVTGGSTAKVTSQHGLIYHELEARQGREAAVHYARSNEAGREWIAQQVETLGIDCGFESCPAYVYATSDENARAVEREVEAAVRVGLPASLERGLDSLPFAVTAAIRFDDQAQFHPVRYVAALAAELAARGGTIHESTRVLDVESGRPLEVVTAHGRVAADDVVIATNLPFLDRGGFFARAFPYRHMAIASPVPDERVPRGMYISADQPTRSFRTAPWNGAERLLVVIGEAFPTGNADTSRRLAQIESFARQHFGIDTPRFRWGNQDYYAADRIPYVGSILPGMPRIKVATGFSAWGITAGTAAAMILSDTIMGRDNDWAPLYDSRRVGWRGGARPLVRKNLAVATSWLAEKLEQPPPRQPESLRPGEGAIVRVGEKAAAAFRDDDGTLLVFDAKCTHMGCRLRWNPAERSWDCHCHGSRFGVRGEVLNGPALTDLRPLERDTPQ